MPVDYGPGVPSDPDPEYKVEDTVNPATRANANGLVAWTEDPINVATARTPLAATIYLRKIMVPVSTTFANILASCSTAGTSYTNTQAGVYSSAGVLLGASPVYASSGTDLLVAAAVVTFPLTAISGQSLIVGGTETSFVWVGLHMGTNSATAAIFQGPAAATQTANAGLGVSAIRTGTYAGHATNALATIGNLTPASISATSLAIWFGVT